MGAARTYCGVRGEISSEVSKNFANSMIEALYVTLIEHRVVTIEGATKMRTLGRVSTLDSSILLTALVRES